MAKSAKYPAFSEGQGWLEVLPA